MEILRLAAFSHNGQGGNPAGVAFYDAMPGMNAPPPFQACNGFITSRCKVKF
jgi:hypothetical protein